MSSDYDIEMTTNDTLEFDTAIKQLENNHNVIDVNTSNSGNYNLNGYQTNTRVFKPKDPDIYNLTINGQELTVKVTDSNSIPNGLIDNFEDGNLNEYESGSAGDGISPAFITTTQSFNKNSSATIDGSGLAQYGSNTLPNLPKRGDTFSFMFRYTENAGTFRWGIAGDDDAGKSYGAELSLGSSSGSDAGRWGSETNNNWFGSMNDFDYTSYRNEWIKCTNKRDSFGDISITIKTQDETVLATGSLNDGGNSSRNGIAFQISGQSKSNFIDFLVNESI